MIACMDKIKSGTQRVPETNSFGARLALIRRDMKWNIKEAERECGISQNRWSDWEYGVTPSNQVRAAEKIAARTGIDPVWIMFGVKSQSLDYQVEVSRPTLRSRPANRTDLTGPRSRA